MENCYKIMDLATFLKKKKAKMGNEIKQLYH